MEFNEFPKRVYVGGKGFTVNTAEEEQALLGAKPLQSPTPSCVDQKIKDEKLITEELPEKIVQVQIRAVPEPKKKAGRPKGAKGKGKKK